MSVEAFSNSQETLLMGSTHSLSSRFTSGPFHSQSVFPRKMWFPGLKRGGGWGKEGERESDLWSKHAQTLEFRGWAAGAKTGNRSQAWPAWTRTCRLHVRMACVTSPAPSITMSNSNTVAGENHSFFGKRRSHPPKNPDKRKGFFFFTLFTTDMKWDKGKSFGLCRIILSKI